MNESLPLIPETDIKSADTTTLKRALAQAVTMTAKSLQYMGMVWKELESRGEDLSGLRGGLVSYLPLIASGKIQAEAVVRYADKSMLLKAMASLPPEDQEKLLAKNEVEVADVSPDGTVTMKAITLSRITSDQIRTAFGPYGLRRPGEQQRLALAMAAPRKRRAQSPDTMPKIDASTGQIRLGRAYFTATGSRLHVDTIIEVLSAHFDTDFKAIIEEKKRAG